MLDLDKEAFVVYIATITSEMTIHLECEAQIALLKAEKALISVPAKYLDFTDIFSKKLVIVLSDYTKINTYTINLEKDKQPSYRPIYSLGWMELDTLKTYIKINLAKSFICLSKSSAGTPILFDQKPDRSL